ncbi:hypothetical protein [Natronorubrum sp. FCH18a]|uniref:hypothetical protein n=1 Tax=Natronorubrum sp. FCH18a TaxID=3447018 RepID=UPI003F514E47
MSSRIKRYVFRKPDGRYQALLFFAFSLVFSGLYVSFGLPLRGGSVSTLVVAVAFGLVRFAESLPTDRRLLSGVLRVLALCLLVTLVTLTVLAPEMILGER